MLKSVNLQHKDQPERGNPILATVDLETQVKALKHAVTLKDALIGLQEKELDKVRLAIAGGAESETGSTAQPRTLAYLTADEYEAFKQLRKFDLQTKLMLQFEAGHINANQDMRSAATGLSAARRENFVREAAVLLGQHLGIVEQIFCAGSGSTPVGEAVAD